MRNLILLLLLFALGSCTFKNNTDEKPLATVGSEQLYLSDIKGIFKSEITKNDSIALLNSMIDKWIRRQKLLMLADLNLTSEEKDVDLKLEEYRTSLLIFKYQQKYIKEKMDTSVSDTEIEEYYNTNPLGFVLSDHLVKAIYVKLPLKAKGVDKFSNLLKQPITENTYEIETYCYQNALKYDYFNDSWINLNQIIKVLPEGSVFPELDLQRNNLFQFKDSTYLYLVRIGEVRQRGGAAPLSSVYMDIKDIILLKRKQKLIKDLETNILLEEVKK